MTAFACVPTADFASCLGSGTWRHQRTKPYGELHVTVRSGNILRRGFTACEWVHGSDAIVRYGGDEFLVLLADTSAAGSQRVIERITTNLSEWNNERHLEGITLGLSIGVAEWHDGESLDEVLDVADRKIFQDKALRPQFSSDRSF